MPLVAYLCNSGLADFSGHGFELRICSQVQLVVPQELEREKKKEQKEGLRAPRG